MLLRDLLAEADTIRTDNDGRYHLPAKWPYLALAILEQEDDHEQITAPNWTTSDEWPPYRTSGFAGDSGSALGQWRTICLGQRTNSVPNIALMDTTTLYTALRLVKADDNRLATPLTVLDLMSFLNTACLYDRICFLENPHVSLADLESVFGRDLFIELPVQSTAQPGSDYAALGDIREELRNLYKSRTAPWLNDVREGRLGTESQRTAWVRSWMTILRQDCSPEWLLRDPDEGGSSKYRDVWNTPTDKLFNNIVDVMTDQLVEVDHRNVIVGRGGQVELAQESNARALFNAELAQQLQVPYTASTVRYPILKLLIDQTRSELAQLLRTQRGARALEEAFGDTVADFMTSQPDALRLPFFPSAILNKVEQPSQLPEQLAWVRARSAVFRAHLAEMDFHLYTGDQAGRRVKPELRAALAQTTGWERRIPGAELAAASGEVALTWADPWHHVLAATVALLYGIIAAGSMQTILTRCRPQYRILRRLDPAANSAPSIARLWAIDAIDPFAARMTELSSVAAQL